MLLLQFERLHFQLEIEVLWVLLRLIFMPAPKFAAIYKAMAFGSPRSIWRLAEVRALTWLMLTCSAHASGGDSGGIITPTRCNDRWIYITVKYPSGKEIAPGALNSQVRSKADCELIANAFRKYEGSFSGSKTIRFCSQYPRSVTANLFECLISPESNNMACTEMAKLPDMATCVGKM